MLQTHHLCWVLMGGGAVPSLGTRGTSQSHCERCSGDEAFSSHQVLPLHHPCICVSCFIQEGSLLCWWTQRPEQTLFISKLVSQWYTLP